MSNLLPGSPMGRAVAVAASTTSAVVTALPIRGTQYQLEVTVSGTGTAYVEIGNPPATGSLTAVAGTSGLVSAPVLSGQSKTYTVGAQQVVAVVSDATPTVYFLPMMGE